MSIFHDKFLDDFGAGHDRPYPADLLPHIRHYADRRQEYLLCASINGANEVMNIRVVSIGLVDRSPAHPREVFAPMP